MKTALRALLFSAVGFAQSTGQVCIIPDKAVPAKIVCQDIPPGVKASLAALVAAQVNTSADGKTITPVYNGIAHLIFSNLTDGLFRTLLAQYPPPPVKTNLDAAATQQAAAQSKIDALAVKVTTADPQ